MNVTDKKYRLPGKSHTDSALKMECISITEWNTGNPPAGVVTERGDC